MATTKLSKRGVLERSRAVPAPVADTVTETRSELCRPDLSPTALNFPHANAKIAVLPTDYKTEQVAEDYTEAYFEHYEDEHLVSSKKSQSGSGRHTHSNSDHSHVNPAFQHDSESSWENKGSSSEAAQPLEVDTTKLSQKEHETRRDTNSKVNSKTKPYHARSQIPKATNKNQAKVLVDSSSGTSAPNLDKPVASTKSYYWQQDEVKSGDSHAEEVDIHINFVDNTNEEIIEVFVDDKNDTDPYVVRPLSPGNNDSLSPTAQRECLDDVLEVAVTQKQPGDGGKAERPHSRSFSSVTAFISNIMGGQLAESNNFQRSKSMRLPVPGNSEVLRVRKPLLRELSFSDCDSNKFRNYGSLRASGGLPKRRQIDFGDEDEDGKKQIPKFLKPELEASLLDLMQQLVGRGKLRQVAVLEQRNGCMLASLPKWQLTHGDEIGLVKAATINLETMLKISVEKEFYTCFKHGKDKIVCHSGDNVLVAQTTNSCVVVGVASDNIPGSCLYEVSELARALLDKGW